MARPCIRVDDVCRSLKRLAPLIPDTGRDVEYLQGFNATFCPNAFKPFASNEIELKSSDSVNAISKLVYRH